MPDEFKVTASWQQKFRWMCEETGVMDDIEIYTVPKTNTQILAEIESWKKICIYCKEEFYDNATNDEFCGSCGINIGIFGLKFVQDHAK